MRRCSIDGCGAKHFGRGWCRKHYMRHRTHGDPLATLYNRDGAPDVCTVAGCEQPHHSHGHCSAHAHRVRRHGDPQAGAPRRHHGDLLDRLTRRLRLTDGGCWLWGGCHDQHGYGWVGVAGGKVRRVHLAAFEELVEPVPEGLELDHVCRHKGCWNPDHLEAVAHAENLRRGREAARCQ